MSARIRRLSEKNHMRKRILEEELLQYVPFLKKSDRDKEIMIAYTEGENYKSLATRYGITPSRVRQIVHEVIVHCGYYQRKVKMYAPKYGPFS